jgi:enoyl-CoA hydratase/carnithine racemase
MQEKPVLVEKANGVCTITINRGEKQNTLNPDVLRGMIAAIRSTGSDPSTRAVVLRGAGEKVFCAGYDLSILPGTVRSFSDRKAQGEEITPEEDLINLSIEAVSDCPVPVIAMIYGPCVGAGCDLAVACDMRLASHTARFAIPAVRRGLAYPPKSVHRLMNLVGAAATREMLLTGAFVDAGRAREIGLVNRVVDAGELAEATYSLAGVMAANGPLGVDATKKIIASYLRVGRLSAADEAEAQNMAMRCAQSADFQEGVRAFLEKRQPRFQGK